MNPTTTKYKMKKLYILLAVLSGLACREKAKMQSTNKAAQSAKSVPVSRFFLFSSSCLRSKLKNGGKIGKNGTRSVFPKFLVIRFQLYRPFVHAQHNIASG